MNVFFRLLDKRKATFQTTLPCHLIRYLHKYYDRSGQFYDKKKLNEKMNEKKDILSIELKLLFPPSVTQSLSCPQRRKSNEKQYQKNGIAQARALVLMQPL